MACVYWLPKSGQINFDTMFTFDILPDVEIMAFLVPHQGNWMSKMVQSAQQILARPFTRTVGSEVDRICGGSLLKPILVATQLIITLKHSAQALERPSQEPACF